MTQILDDCDSDGESLPLFSGPFSVFAKDSLKIHIDTSLSSGVCRSSVWTVSDTSNPDKCPQKKKKSGTGNDDGRYREGLNSVHCPANALDPKKTC